MMKTFRLCTVALMLMSGLLISCGGGGSSKSSGGGGGTKASSPKAMTEAFWKIMEKKQYEKAADFFMDNAELASDMTAERKAEIREGMLKLFEWGGKEHEKSGGVSKVEVGEAVVEDGKATVSVKVTYGNGETEDHNDRYHKDASGKWRLGDTDLD